MTGAGGRETPRALPLFLPSFWGAIMENPDIVVIILAVVLPVYPALWTIYQKIGQYDAVCADFERLKDEHRKNHYVEHQHGTRTHHDH